MSLAFVDSTSNWNTVCQLFKVYIWVCSMFVQCFTIKSHCIFVSLKTSCTIKTRCIDDDIHYVGVVKPHHRLMHGARRKKVECNRYHIAKCAAVLLCGDMDRYNNDILSLLWFRPLLLARLGCCSVELHRGESLISPVSVTSCCSIVDLWCFFPFWCVFLYKM